MVQTLIHIVLAQDAAASAYTMLSVTSDGKLRYLHRVPPGSTGGENIIPNTPTCKDDNWHHVAAVYDGSNMTLSMDGIIIGTATPNTQISDTFRAYIGTNGTNYNFEGDIDELRIWSTARTQGQIQNYMYKTLGSESGLTAYYKFDEGSGTSAADSAGNNDGTLTNSPAWVTSGLTLNPGKNLVVDSTADTLDGDISAGNNTLRDAIY